MKAETNFVFNVSNFENLSKILVGLFGSLQSSEKNKKFHVSQKSLIIFTIQNIYN